MDDLLEHLRREIAMDGDEGTPAHRLDGFVAAYFVNQSAHQSSLTSSSSAGATAALAITQQNLDSAFNEFVWRQLISLPEITVAYLRPASATTAYFPSISDDRNAGLSTAVGADEHDQVAKRDEDQTAETLESSAAAAITESPAADSMSVDVTIQDIPIDAPRSRKGKLPSLKAKKAALKLQLTDLNKRQRDARIADQYVQTFEFVQIDLQKVLVTPRYQLEQAYGAANLRIASDPESCYRALTGSHERHSRLTHLCYQILQAIARGRERGKTVIELGHEFSHDQKSLFHFVKNLVEMNLIVKFRVLDARAHTSRCIHRHYLERSEYWATQLVQDTENDQSRNIAADNAEDEEVEEAAESNQLAKPSLITVAHLHANEPLIRSRIISALKRGEHNMQPHADLIFECGFATRPPRLECRRFNRIINNLCDKGLIERVGISRDASRGPTSYLRLKPHTNLESTEAQTDAAGQSNVPDDTRVNIILSIPVEKQAVDFVAEAGAAGATIREVRAGVGDINHRIIETLLARFEKNPQPPHLSDYQLFSVIETEGRQKRLRYFTLSGYRERCRQDGIQAPDAASSAFEDLAGGFSVNEATGYYDKPRAFAKHIRSVNTTVGLVNAGKADSARRPRNGRPTTKKSKPTRDEQSAETGPLAKRQRKNTAKASIKAVAATKAVKTDEQSAADASPDLSTVAMAASAAASELGDIELPLMKRRGRPPGSRKLLKMQALIDEYTARNVPIPQDLLDDLERCKKIKYTCKAKQLSVAERVELTGIADAFEDAQAIALNPAWVSAPSKRKRLAGAVGAGSESETAHASGGTKRRRSRKNTENSGNAAQAGEADIPPLVAPSAAVDRIETASKSKEQTSKQTSSTVNSIAPDAPALSPQAANLQPLAGRFLPTDATAETHVLAGTSADNTATDETTIRVDQPGNKMHSAADPVPANSPSQSDNADPPQGTLRQPVGSALAPDPTFALSATRRLSKAATVSSDFHALAQASQTSIVKPKTMAAGPVIRMMKVPHVPVGSRVNLSNLRHERDLEQVLTAVGGIAEEIEMLKQLNEVRMAKIEPGQPVYKLDKRTERLVMNGLEERGIIKCCRMQLSLGQGKMVTRSVLYLSSIDIAGQAGQLFAQRLQQRAVEAANTRSWLNDRPVLYQKGASKPVADKRQRIQRLVEADLVTEDPRQLFSADWRVAAQWYGWVPGIVARSRLLYEFMHRHREALTASNHLPPAGNQFASIALDSFTRVMPLLTYLKIVPCTSLSTDLDDFLKSDDALTATLDTTPSELRRQLIPDSGSFHKRMRRLLDILTYLEVVHPVSQSLSVTDVDMEVGTGASPAHSNPLVKAWILASTVPIHDFSSGQEHLPLLGQFEMVNEADVTRYWSALEAVCMGEQINMTSLTPAASLYASPDKSSAHAQILLQRKSWRSRPTMYKAQKTYVERTLKKLGKKAVTIINSESALVELARSLCVSNALVLKTHINKLRKKLSRRKKSSARTKNTAGIASDALLPRSTLTEESESEPDERTRPSTQNPARPPNASREVLQRQKEQIWQAHIRDAHRRHAWFAFDQQHLEFLHHWFLSPDGLSVKALSEHIETMIEDASMLKIAVGAWTKPNNTFEEFRAHDSHLGRTHWGSMPLPPPQGLTQTRASVEQALLPVATFRQNFADLIRPMEPVSIDNETHKTVTTGWNATEDDQLRDFYVIIWAKTVSSANSSDTPKVDIAPVVQYYPGCEKRLLLDRLRRLCRHESEAPYMDALGSAWLDLWLHHRGTHLLPDAYPGDAAKVDLLRCRALLCSKLNKQAIRFAAVGPTSLNLARAELPRNALGIAEAFTYDPRSNLGKINEASFWDFLWGPTTVAARSNLYHSKTFAQKATVVNAHHGSQPGCATDRIAAMSTIHRLHQRDTQDLQATALAFSNRVQIEKTVDWQNLAEDGDMLAVCEMFSRHTIDLKLDTSATLDGRPYTDYRTRRIDDSSFENPVTIIMRPTP